MNYKLDKEYFDASMFGIELGSTEALEEDGGTPKVRMIASDESQVKRYFYDIILSHDKDAVDLNRAHNGMSWLFNHDRDKYLGKCVEATLGDGKLALTVEPALVDQFASEKYQLIKSGHLQKVSVGIDIMEYEQVDETEDGDEVLLCTMWAPFEISSVTIPAIDSVGVYHKELPEPSVTYSFLTDNPLAGKVNILNKGRKGMDPNKAKDYTKEILEIVTNEYPEHAALGVKIATEGGTPADFHKAVVLAEREAREPAKIDKPELELEDQGDKPAGPQKIEFDVRDMRRFSLHRYAKYVESNHSEHEKSKADLELGMVKEARQELDNRGATFSGNGEYIIPNEFLGGSFSEVAPMYRVLRQHGPEGLNAIREEQFALSVGGTDTAGNLVETVLRADQFVTALINASKVMPYMSYLDGLVGNIDIPRGTKTVSAAWLGETEGVTASDPEFDKVTGEPHRLSIATTMSHRLQMQSQPSVEMVLRSMMPEVAGSKIDETVLRGTGANSPSGINSVAGRFTDTRTGEKEVAWETFLAMCQTLYEKNLGEDGPSPWFCSPAMWTQLSQTRINSTIRPSGGSAGGRTGGIDEMAMVNGMMLGQPVHVTNNGVATTLTKFLPKYSIVCQWGMAEFLLDPYTGAGTAQDKLYFTMWLDIVHTRPGAITESVG